jgi:predicted site-specific integrase-resolvase
MPSQANIPTYIPFDQAARHYGLSKKVLTQEIQAGKIRAVQLPSGDLLVAAENNGRDYQTKKEIIAQKFAHLRGEGISAYAASKKYGIHHQNFINWARSGYIKIKEEKIRLLKMDEADVAYCAYVFKQKKEEYGGRIAGAKIFDEEGNPYQVKYPDLAAQRRK